MEQVEACKESLPSDTYSQLYKYIDSIEDDNKMIHGDFQIKNLMKQDDEILLIDMDNLSYGNPIFELGAMYATYVAFSSVNKNNALEFLGINTLTTEKKERLISDEASSNNELINMNLQSYLVPRQEACRLFNEKYGLTGTDKEISVRVRSDLYNLIKQNESIISDYKDNEDGIIDNEEVIYNE